MKKLSNSAIELGKVWEGCGKRELKRGLKRELKRAHSKQASRQALGVHSVGAMPWRGLFILKIVVRIKRPDSSDSKRMRKKRIT